MKIVNYPLRMILYDNIWLIFMVNVGIYTTNGCYGLGNCIILYSII